MATAAQRPKSFQRIGGTNERKKKKTKSRDCDLQMMEMVQNELNLPSYVFDIPTLPNLVKSHEFQEGEERVFISDESWRIPKIQNLIRSLLDWMNDVLAVERIVLTDLVEDLYDGLILRKLLEHLTTQVDMAYSPLPLATLNKEEQLKTLSEILNKYAEILGPVHLWDPIAWTVESITNKHVVVIIQLTVALAVYFRAPIALLHQQPPSRCQIRAIVVKKHNCHLHGREITAHLIPALPGVFGESRTGLISIHNQPEERDAFDTLFDHAPEKLNNVSKAVLAFVNTKLNKLNIHVNDLTQQFRNGVNLILLVGVLEGYFVPFYQYNPTPKYYTDEVENVRLAFRLLDEAGVAHPKCRPEDIVNADPKCTLRTLFTLYNRYHRV